MGIVRSFSTAALVAAGVALSVPTCAQPAVVVDEAMIADFYAELAADPAAFRARMALLTGPMSSETWGIAVQHLLPLIVDPAYAAYVVDRIEDGLTRDGVERSLVAFTVWGDALTAGMRRLPPEAQEAHFAAQADIIDWIAVNASTHCRTLRNAGEDALPFGTISPAIADFARVVGGPTFSLLAQRGAAAAEDYFGRLAEAVAAEIHDAPAARIRPPPQTAAPALIAYQLAVLEEREARNERTAAAPRNVGMPDLWPICDALAAPLAAVADLDQADREAVMRMMLESPSDGLQPGPSLGMSFVEAYYGALADDLHTHRRLVEGTVGNTFDDTAFAAMAARVEPLLREPRLASYAFYSLGPATPIEATQPLAGLAAMTQLFVAGFPRLPIDRQETFLTGVVTAFTWTRDNAPARCSLAIDFARGDAPVGLPPTFSDVDRFYAENPQFLDTYYGLFAEAVLAELYNSPSYPTLDGAVFEKAMASWSDAVRVRLKTAPNADELMDAAAVIERGVDPGVPPAALCDAAMLPFLAMQDLQREDRAVALQVFFATITEPQERSPYHPLDPNLAR